MPRNLMDVNCNRCGDGPKDKVNSTQAVEYAEKHGKEEHGTPTVGLKVNQRTK